jgi:hypothetical protein
VVAELLAIANLVVVAVMLKERLRWLLVLL